MTSKERTAKVGTDLSTNRAQARKDSRNATNLRNRRLARLTYQQDITFGVMKKTMLPTFSEKMALFRVMLEIRRLSAN